ncbi:MAG: (2,3-dihydroxybenzoyl)adenylate synthase [Acidobacteriota bacterium]|nr:MAG: (2,3-dihydroxybenzoyl)adenylate synthase [Acidobacteriota bacterium]
MSSPVGSLRPSRYGDDIIDRYRQNGFWTEDTAVSLLQAKAAAEPDAIAVSDSTTRLTWSELLDEAERVASGLVRLGLERGDPVVIQLPNWVESVVLRYALKTAGLVAIYAPLTWRIQEIRQVLEKTGARLLVAPPTFRQLDFQAMTAELGREFPDLMSVFVRGEAPKLEGACSWESLTQDRALPHPCPTKAEEVSLICVSSGSTGVPKLCESPEAAQLVNGRGIGERFGVTAKDVVGIFAPTDGGAGLMGFLIAIAAGCPIALADDFQPEAMLDRIEAERVSILATVPALLIRLLQVSDVSHRDLSALRLIRTGTAALTPATAREAEKRFGAMLVPAAGTMEVLTFAQTGPEDPEEVRLGGGVGCPLSGNEARVVSDDGKPLDSGELGVLEVRGAGTGSGYYTDREATLEAWGDGQGEGQGEGWFRTGDLAVIAEDGRIRLCGRTKDVISRGGRNVFPAELEALLMEHEKVQDVAVVGVENAALGECARAYIVPRGQHGQHAEGDLTESELREFLEKKQIATYKIPDEFRFLTELPRLPGAKVNRRALKAEA